MKRLIAAHLLASMDESARQTITSPMANRWDSEEADIIARVCDNTNRRRSIKDVQTRIVVFPKNWILVRVTGLASPQVSNPNTHFSKMHTCSI